MEHHLAAVQTNVRKCLHQYPKTAQGVLPRSSPPWTLDAAVIAAVALLPLMLLSLHWPLMSALTPRCGYHFSACSTDTRATRYQTTLNRLRQEFDRRKIPVGAIQYDSWWYYKVVLAFLIAF